MKVAVILELWVGIAIGSQHSWLLECCTGARAALSVLLGVGVSRRRSSKLTASFPFQYFDSTSLGQRKTYWPENNLLLDPEKFCFG